MLQVGKAQKVGGGRQNVVVCDDESGDSSLSSCQVSSPRKANAARDVARATLQISC